MQKLLRGRKGFWFLLLNPWVLGVATLLLLFGFGGALFSINRLVDKLFANPIVTIAVIVGVVIILRFVSG